MGVKITIIRVSLLSFAHCVRNCMASCIAAMHVQSTSRIDSVSSMHSPQAIQVLSGARERQGLELAMT